MEVTIRRDKENTWGFVESFSIYGYKGKGAITVTAVVTPEGDLASPYVLRGNLFIPLSQIDEEMGIEKYIKAKKPIYSRLQDGFLVKIRAGYDFETRQFLLDSSQYSVYSILEKSIQDNEGTLKLSPILEIPEKLDTLMKNLAEQVSKCGGIRYNYLKNRLGVTQ